MIYTFHASRLYKYAYSSIMAKNEPYKMNKCRLIRSSSKNFCSTDTGRNFKNTNDNNKELLNIFLKNMIRIFITPLKFWLNVTGM